LTLARDGKIWKPTRAALGTVTQSGGTAGYAFAGFPLSQLPVASHAVGERLAAETLAVSVVLGELRLEKA